MANYRNFEEYRAEVLTKLGVDYTVEDLRNFERWRLKVLEGLANLYEADYYEPKIQEAVEGWLDDHPEASTTVTDGAVTTAKLASNAVATAKIVDGAVTDAKLASNGVKSNLSSLFYETPIIEQGYWAGADGTKGSSNAWCRLKSYLPKGYVLKSTNIMMYVACFAEDDTYVGSWNGTTWAKGAFANIYTRYFDISEWIDKYPSYKFTLSFYKSGANITPTDVYNDVVITNVLNGSNIENISKTQNASIFKSDNLVPSNSSSWKQGTTGEAGALRAIYSEIDASDYAGKSLYLFGKVDPDVLAYGYDFYVEEYNGNTLVAYDHITATGAGAYKVVTLNASTEIVKLVLTTGNNSKPITPAYIDTHPLLYFGESAVTVDYEFKYQYDDVRYKEIQALEKRYLSNDIVSLNYDTALKIKEAKKVSYSTVVPLTLLHFSDIHGAGGTLARVLNYYKENASLINDVICTGDMVYDKYTDGMTYWDAVDGTEDILTCIGNHEVSDGDIYTQDMIGQEASYARYFAPYIDNWGVNYTEDLTYWYKDYEDSNVRLIALNYLLTGAEMTAQVSWLSSLLSEAKTNEYTVVIAIHTPPNGAVKIPCNFTPVYINLISDGLGDYADIMDAVQDFINDGGDFACYIGGHTHCDFICKHPSYPDQTFFIVTTAVANGTANDQYREVGTKTQDAFNVCIIDTVTKTVKLIRVGADADCYLRERNALAFDYVNKTFIAEN